MEAINSQADLKKWERNEVEKRKKVNQKFLRMEYLKVKKASFLRSDTWSVHLGEQQCLC